MLPWTSGPADNVCNVCCYVGSMPKCFREKKEWECCANPLQRLSQNVEYLLWAAWFSVLAFGIKVGRLKHFLGISWWSHFRWIKSWRPNKPVYRTDRGKDIRSCSLSSPASTVVLCVKRQADGKRGVSNMYCQFTGLTCFLVSPITAAVECNSAFFYSGIQTDTVINKLLPPCGSTYWQIDSWDTNVSFTSFINGLKGKAVWIILISATFYRAASIGMETCYLGRSTHNGITHCIILCQLPSWKLF